MKVQNTVRAIARVTKKPAKKIWGFIKSHKLELTYRNPRQKAHSL